MKFIEAFKAFSINSSKDERGRKIYGFFFYLMEKSYILTDHSTELPPHKITNKLDKFNPRFNHLS